MDQTTDPIRSVCFTGHRPAGLPAPGSEEMAALSARLSGAVRSAITRGATMFYAGGAMGFDMMAEEAVLSLRQEYPQIKLILCLPAPNQAERFGKQARARYDAILAQADSVSYAETVCSPRAMHARDRYLVEHADECICYLKKFSGGTHYTVSHALKQGIPVINLAMPAGDAVAEKIS